jgi:hypothetical protein
MSDPPKFHQLLKAWAGRLVAVNLVAWVVLVFAVARHWIAPIWLVGGLVGLSALELLAFRAWYWYHRPTSQSVQIRVTA